MSPKPLIRARYLLLAAAFLTAIARPAAAQAWADLRYQYRAAVDVSYGGTDQAAGSIVALTVPSSLLAGKVRADMSDVALYAGHQALPCRVLAMGGSVKTLFALPEALTASSPAIPLHLYFGAPSGERPPLPSGLQLWDFSDASLHGWKSLQDPAGTGGSASDVRLANDALGLPSLVLTTARYHHPMAFASEGVPMASATVYARIRTNGGENEVGLFQRFNTQVLTDNKGVEYTTGAETPGVGLALDCYGSQQMPLATFLDSPDADGFRRPGPGIIGGGSAYVADPGKYQFFVTATEDGANGTTLRAKAWQAALTAGDPDPAAWQKTVGTWSHISEQPLPAGLPAVMIYGTSVHIGWVAAVPNPRAEAVLTTAGAVETAPDPGVGQAVVQGTVYDEGRGVQFGVANAEVRIRNAAGVVEATLGADELGRYRIMLPAGPTPVTKTIEASSGAMTGSATQEIVEAATYTVNVGLAHPGIVSGRVTDADGQPVEGAAVGGFLDSGPFTMTGPDGRYVLRVPLAAVVIGAHKEGYRLSGPRWLNASSGAATADFVLFEQGDDLLRSLTPSVSPAPGASTAALTDGNPSSLWTSPQTAPVTITFTLPKVTVGEVIVHWKEFPAAWRVELTNTITASNGKYPSPSTRTYYSAGETTADENGGYAVPATDRRVVAIKTAPVYDVTKLSIVITRMPGQAPPSLYGIEAFGPEPPTGLQDAVRVARVAAGVAPMPTDPNAFYRWNASNEDALLDLKDAVELARDATREVKIHRVLAINYVPFYEAANKTIGQYFGWRNPYTNTEGHRRDMEMASHNYLRIQMLPQITVDGYPLFTDGTRFTDESFIHAWNVRPAEWNKSADVNDIIRTFDLNRRVNVGDVDEIWVQALPGFGMPETQMAGPNAYWCNSGPVPGNNGNRLYIFTFFNYERENNVMIEDWGHRMESILGFKVYGGWNSVTGNTTFDRWTRIDKNNPGEGAVGNAHYPVNGQSDYDYANTTMVWSTADDWLKYPNLTGLKQKVSCRNWAGPYVNDYHRNYLIWMFYRMPVAPGLGPDGKQANWWKYVVNPNAQEESR